MATFFETGCWVWIPDPVEVIVPAKVQTAFHKGEPGKVLVDGKTCTISATDSAQCTLADPQTLNPNVDNMTLLDDLNENRYVKAFLQ